MRTLVLATLGVLAISSLAVDARADATPVTSCGQQVVSGTGMLTADLDCTSSQGFAVLLGNGARLNLNGFTITGGTDGVSCSGACRVTGPGTIARATSAVNGDGTCVASYGVFGGGAVVIEHVGFVNWGYATYGGERIRARDVDVTGLCLGIVGNYARVTVRDSQVTNNAGLGIAGAGGVTVVRSTVTGNYIDITAAKRPHVRKSTCDTSSALSPVTPGEDYWGVCTTP